jgi:hypothetical protein
MGRHGVRSLGQDHAHEPFLVLVKGGEDRGERDGFAKVEVLNQVEAIPHRASG